MRRVLRACSGLFFAGAVLFTMPKTIFAVGAGGYTNQVAGARALGQANAFAAQADDSSAVTFNPAGLTQIKSHEISAGFTGQLPMTDYTSSAGIKDKTERNFSLTPNIYLASKLGQEKWGFGLGVTVPFGLSTEWKGDSQVRYVATESKLQVINFNPSVSYQATETMALGAGIDYYLSPTLELSKKVNNQTGAADGDQKFDADGDGWGFNVGALWKPGEQHSFGLTYRSEVKVDYEGTVMLSNLDPLGTGFAFGDGVTGVSSYSTGVNGDITYPQNVTAGYAYKANDKWLVELDVEWTGWQSFDEAQINFDEPNAAIRAALDNNDNPSPKNWKNVVSLALGTDYKLRDNLSLRGGYFFYDTPVPNSTFEPSTPDSDVHGLTLGTGVVLSNVIVDFAYQAYFFTSRNVDNNVGANVASSVDGKYKTFANSFALNLTYRF